MSSFEDEKAGGSLAVVILPLFILVAGLALFLLSGRVARLEAIHAEEIRLEVEQH